MPPSFDELSLRHLPDISDASFSFQIPSSSTADLLLDPDDEKDFFQNADVSLATPGPSRISHTPLTLSELTPKQDARAYQPPQGGPSPLHDRPPKQIPRGLGNAAQARTALPKAAKQPPLKVTTQVNELRGPEASPRVARLRTLRTEVDSLSDDARESAIPSSSSLAHEHATEKGQGQTAGSKKERIMVRPKQVVYSGGISKVRSKPGPSSARTRTLPSAPPSQTLQAPAPAPAELVRLATSEYTELEENPDLSVCSTTSGGVAERLVMYSQKLIGSFGLFNTDQDNVSPQPGSISPGSQQSKSYPVIEANVHVHVGARGDHASSNEDPFTLSQISPPKPECLRPASPATTSPMRPSRKRPVSVASSSSSSSLARQASSKKGKAAPRADHAPHASDTRGSNTAPEKTLAGSRSRRVSGSGRTRALATKTRGGVRRAVGRQGPRPVTRPGAGEGRLASSSSSCSATLRASRGENLDVLGASAQVDDRAGGGHPGAGSWEVTGGHDADAGVDGQQCDTRVVLPAVNATRPVGFRFQLDARMEARKAEHEHEHEKEKERLGTGQKRRTQPHHQHHGVPDFKSLHAQLEAARALRKENIHPVVPRAVELSTDSRAREREKFDLRVREREREMERLEEERRREREEEEEREVREMRRRAVVRAHEVPEWYREAPKRKMQG